MSDHAGLSPSNYRRAQVNFAICSLLADRSAPMQVQEILQEVYRVLPPVGKEQEPIQGGRLRYDIFIRRSSSGLSRAGLIRKSGAQGRWEIAEEGKKALKDHPDEVALFEHMRSVNRALRQERKSPLGTWGLIDGIVARVPMGRWISFSDLEAVTGKPSGVTGVHMRTEKPTGWHRILRQNGTITADQSGDDRRADQQRELLEREGVATDPRAPDSLRLPRKELEELAATIRVPPRAWLVRGTSVRGASIVPEWLAGSFVSLPASQLPMLPPDPQDSEIQEAVEQGYEGLGYSQRSAKFEELRTFIKRVQPGHLLMTTSGNDVYVGEILGDLEQVESAGRRSNLRRRMMWINPESPESVNDLPLRLTGRLRSQADIVDLTDLYDEVSALAGADDERDSGSKEPEQELASMLEPLPFLTAAVAEGLLIGRAWLDEFVHLLNMRPQVILYGPPGTGKTFLAQSVAEALAGPERVTLVQFHPSYAYEDFFEGYRPAGSGDGGVSLQLVPGPFRKVVDLARANPSEPYFLIIDEINRANLAKVFGELYFLLEYRDRSIDLLYSSGDAGPAFSLPANVYIIGTMNTADRSIALVDAAMRRRFAFLSLHPDDERLDLVLRQWLAERNLPADRADLFVELNRRIANKDMKIGPSYLMSSSVAEEAGLDRIWRTSILPLLEEYHVGDSVDVKAKYGLAALRRLMDPPVPGE